MTFSEILIIYLSLGAPVAVYYLQRRIHLRNPSDVAKALFAFLLWPITLLGIISAAGVYRSESTFAKRPVPDAQGSELFLAIFELAKRDLNQNGRGREIAQFREMMERYAGLLDASRNEDAGSAQLADLYAVAGSPNADLAIICQSRRAGAKLERHARAVSAELRQFFGEHRTSDELRAAVATLAGELDDQATAIHLKSGSGLSDARSNTALDTAVVQPHPGSARAA